MEYQQGHGHHNLHDYEEETVSPSGCNCFQFFCFKRRHTNEAEHRHLLNNQEGEGNNQQQYKEESWLVNSSKKVREISEIVAGPKWKTFIRKLSGYVKNKKQQKFQYDPVSYALNFDSRVESEDDEFVPNFSSRFSAPVVDQKVGLGPSL